MVDLIIPAYNAHSTLDRCIGSILMQTVLADIRVTIVDDCSPEGSYDDIVERYKPVMDIQCLRVDKNGGPGVARQYGIDRTDYEYMIFMDSDDTLFNAYAIETLLEAFDKHPDACAIFGSFLEESPTGFNPRDHDVTWLHGKMYRRSFWDKYGVRFHPTSRANEDNGVNATIRLIARENDVPIVFCTDIIYCWHYCSGSITRMNDHAYYFTSSYSGFVDNIIYAIKNAQAAIGDTTETIWQYAANIMCFLYAYWCETAQYYPEYADINYEHCRRFYNEVYRDMAAIVPFDYFASTYTSTMQASYKRFPTIIPTQTIFQVLTDFKAKKG